MISAFGLVARGRHVLLTAAFGLAVLLSIASREYWWLAVGAMAVLTIVLYGLSIVAILLYHPRTVRLRPELPAFDAPLNPNRVLLAGAFTFLGTSLVSVEHAGQSWPVRVIATGVLAVVTLVICYLGWRWHGVRLTPEGLSDLQPFGSVFVPWSAFAAHDPAVPIGRNQLALYFDRPELVVRRGIRPGSSHYLTAGADARLLARMIATYVASPDRRAEIGTEPELSKAELRAG
ncbi:hypothetical protein Adu01nite_45190 [Paractinoplanes durhamensis]|uniref:PH domain-containing protein n=2 Tax=Paractinoplanes durhamensis TaxID=113563 RepID=A0ABQ3Z012_9ACTN|nr:hypothetical protein Adu01nite_45190 [Actinoplanes durhamensis]